MASPAELTDEERELITVAAGDVFDVQYESDQWVVAVQPTGTADESEAASSEDSSGNAGDQVLPEAYLHSALVVATPVHDMAQFLPRKLLDGALGRGRYKDFLKERVSACVVFERSLDLPFAFGVLTAKGSPVTVAINESSRQRAATPSSTAEGEQRVGEGAAAGMEETWVLQSDTGWARAALDADKSEDAMADELLASFAHALGEKRGHALPAVRTREVVCWPYGDMDYELDDGCVWLGETQLALAGDWAFNGRVEGAWLSGRAAAQKLLADRRKE